MAKRDLSTDPVNLSAMWKKAKKIYTKLKKAGISDIIIAAILGNIAQESSFDHKARVGKHSGYFGNLPEIENWIIKNFGGYDDIHLTNYLIAGLTGKLPDTKSIWGKDLKGRYDKFLNRLTKNTSVAQATKLWEDAYEKSGGQSLLQRINYANYFYNQILQLNGNSLPKVSDKLNKNLSLPKWANPNFSKSTKLTSNSNYNFISDNSYIEYPTYSLDDIKTEFDLPLLATNFKKGGKLIKKGQQGVILRKTIHLKKDGNEPKSPHSELKSWFAGITPEERMDLTTLLLNEKLSTYKPTKELLLASLGITHPFSWKDVIPAVLPIAIPTAITAPAWGPVVGTTLVNPATYINIGTKVIPELVKDYVTYAAADAASEALTDKGIAAHVNNALGLPEEEHPIGEAIGFAGTSLFKKPLEKGIISAYKGLKGAILPEYALSLAMNESLWKPYVSKIVQENGKIRLRLPSHTDATPREIVLEPQGNNKFYVHVRTWDGEKIPANLSERDKGYLYEALYNELPEGAEILFPESGPGNYATRGTVAGLQKLGRDPRFSKGSPGTLLYIDKDGSIKEFTGTSFIKNTPLLIQTLYTPIVSNYDNAPEWAPITKDWALHSTDNIKIVESDNGVDILLYNNKNKHIGGLSLIDLGNGLFDVAMINSTYPGGSGPLYNAGVKYGQLKYGSLFKGIRSGDSLVFPEKTLNVTNKFPRYQVGNRGAHIYGFGEFKFGPVHMLTGLSSYYPQLELPRYAIIPKNARQATDDMWNWAFNRALYEGNIKEARRIFDLHFKVNAGKYPTTQGGDIKSLFRGEPMDFNSFKDTGVWLTDDSKYALNYTIDPYDFDPVPYKPLVQRYYVKGQEEQILPKKILSDLPDGPDKEFLWKLIADDLMRNITSNFNGYPEYVREEVGEEVFPHFNPEWLGGTSAKRYRLGTADIISGHDKPMIPEGIYKNWIPSKGTEYLVRNPNYVKSAKLVTYDDNGKMIPLSKRHNFTINDRRFNKGGKLKIK